MGSRFLRRPQAAEFLTEKGLEISPQTLAKYVTVGGGPKMYKLTNKALYTREDLLAWAADRMGCPLEILV